MIANPKWFNLRKYSGWGLTPNCWQGWAYIFAYILPVTIISSLSLAQNIKNILTIILMAILVIDVLHLMTIIKQDERERLHEALADRNALWFMMFILIIGVFIKQVVDPIFLIAVLGATLVKAITQFYLRDK
jgi:hypothetical protein